MSNDYDNRILQGVEGLTPGVWPAGDPPKSAYADGWYVVMVQNGGVVTPAVDRWHSGCGVRPVMVGWGNPGLGSVLCHHRLILPVLPIRPRQTDNEGKAG